MIISTSLCVFVRWTAYKVPLTQAAVDVITHLQVPVHDVMLVDVTDALQDLIDAMAGRDKEEDLC